MIKQFVVILILTSSNFVLAQQKIGIDTSILGSPLQGIYYEKFFSIDSSGSKYFIGTFKISCTLENTTIYTNSNIPSDISRGVYIAKFDSTNKFIWLKKIAESDSLTGLTCSSDKKGNLLLGLNYRAPLTLLNSTYQMNGLNDFILVNLDSSGNTIFIKQVSNSCHDFITSITTDSNNNIYFSGNFGIDINNFPNNCISYFDTIIVPNLFKSFIAKIDYLGNYIWIKTFDYDAIDKIVQENENLYLLSTVSKNIINVDGISINFPFSYKSKCLLTKLNNNGNGIWVRKFGTTESLQLIVANKLCVKNNRVFFSGGSFSNTQNLYLFDGGPTLVGSDQRDYFIAAYDTNGHFKWNTISQSLGNEFISALATDSMCNLYGVGAIDYTTKFSTDTLHTYGANDVMVCSYDSNGNYKWAFNAGGWGTDIGSAITPDHQGNMYIAGGTTSAVCYMGNDTLYPNPSLSTFFFARLDSIPFTAPLGMESTYHNLQNMHVFSNPSNGIYTIQFDQTNSAKGTVTVLNTLGQQVFQTNIPAHAQWFNLNTSYLSNGIYLLQYRTEQKAYSVKLIIQK